MLGRYIPARACAAANGWKLDVLRRLTFVGLLDGVGELVGKEKMYSEAELLLIVLGGFLMRHGLNRRQAFLLAHAHADMIRSACGAEQSADVIAKIGLDLDRGMSPVSVCNPAVAVGLFMINLSEMHRRLCERIKSFLEDNNE